MSKISYPNLIKDIANSYREATGTTELVAIGELADKIEEAIESAGKASQKTLSAEGNIRIILPVYTDLPVVQSNNNNNISVNTTVTLESEG